MCGAATQRLSEFVAACNAVAECMPMATEQQVVSETQRTSDFLGSSFNMLARDACSPHHHRRRRPHRDEFQGACGSRVVLEHNLSAAQTPHPRSHARGRTHSSVAAHNRTEYFQALPVTEGAALWSYAYVASHGSISPVESRCAKASDTDARAIHYSWKLRSLRSNSCY